jgi:hypothetical protein
MLHQLHQLPACCRGLTALLLQQPLDLKQRRQSNLNQDAPQQQQQEFGMTELLAQLPQLLLLSLTAPDSKRVMDAAAKSSVRVLLRLQQALQASQGAATDFEGPPLQLLPGFACQRQAAAKAFAAAMRNPRWAQ